MKKLTFGPDHKCFSISHPLADDGVYLLYCIDRDLVKDIIDRILKKHEINVYHIDYNTGMTEYLCLIDVAYETDDKKMSIALTEIVNTISKKKYIM